MPISCGIHLSGAKQPKSPVARRSPSKRPATGGELGATLATLMLASGINIGQRPTPTRRGMVIPYVPNHRWDRTWTFCLTSSEDDAANTVLPGFYEDFHGETDHSMEYIEMSPPQSSHGHSLASMGVKHTHTQIPSYYHRYPSLQANVLPLPTMCQLGSYSVPFTPKNWIKRTYQNHPVTHQPRLISWFRHFIHPPVDVLSTQKSMADSAILVVH